MEYWLSVKVHNVDNNIGVKLIVVFKYKLKSTRYFTIYLVLVTDFS